MNKKNLPFQIITLALFIGLIVPVAIQDGMFMDGLIYACIAKNLANGLGTFWDPHFSASFMTSYHEQPPLFFGLESIFFRLFGDSIYVERAFSLLLGCITAYFIHLIWKLIHRSNSDIQQASWFPILLWTITPVCFWGYAYNVEETIMGTFAAGSVYFILQAITKNSIPYLVLGGLFIFLSSFCKGIQGLFPITSVFIYWLITKNISLKKMLSFSIILIAIPTVIYLLLFTHDAVIASYSAYFQDRLVGTFQKEHIATTTNRLYLLYRLLCELLPAIAICILITIINNRCKTPKLTNPNLKTAYFFIFLGLSGSIPLIVTLEQRGFYLITTIPYFAIGLAIISSFKLAPLLEKISVHTRGFKVLKITSIILLISALSLSGLMLGKTKRHHDILHDVYLIGENIPNFSIIDVPYKIWRIWALQAYFVRHFNIGLDASKQKHKYLMLEKKTNAPKNHIEIPINLRRFKLYQRN